MYTLAYLGPEGTFSQEAATLYERLLGVPCEQLPGQDFEQIFSWVSQGRVDYGIVPIENSLEGSVTTNLDLLTTEDIFIRGEVILDIDHCLLGLGEGAEILEIISHPQALAQCRRNLKRLYPDARVISATSTSHAAREVAQGGRAERVALGTRAAAKIYGLKVLQTNMADNPENQTRFLVLSRKDHPLTGLDKTSIVVSPQANRPGALHGIIEPFARLGINLTKIESRPTKRFLGEYVFFIDFEGHREQPAVKQILQQLKEETSFMKMLGSYPQYIRKVRAKAAL